MKEFVPGLVVREVATRVASGYTFTEMDKMTTREIAALKQATLDILAAKRQKRYSDIGTILRLQTEIEKEE